MSSMATEHGVPGDSQSIDLRIYERSVELLFEDAARFLANFHLHRARVLIPYLESRMQAALAERDLSFPSWQTPHARLAIDCPGIAVLRAGCERQQLFFKFINEPEIAIDGDELTEEWLAGVVDRVMEIKAVQRALSDAANALLDPLSRGQHGPPSPGADARARTRGRASPRCVHRHRRSHERRTPDRSRAR